MIYKCDCCGKIIDTDRLQTENEDSTKCPYCGQTDYQDPWSGISSPAVRIATKQEVASYENVLHRSSEEQEERSSFCEELIASNKEKIRQAFGNRQARNFEKYMRKDIETSQYDDLDLDEWEGFLQEIASLYSFSLAMASIKYTPKEYRKPWTKERIDNIADICDMEDWARSNLYKKVGIANV